MNLVQLPMWLFSGIFFSADRFPDALQPVVQSLPLTQLNNALRAVILEGASLESQGLEAGDAGCVGRDFVSLRFALVSLELMTAPARSIHRRRSPANKKPCLMPAKAMHTDRVCVFPCPEMFAAFS